MSLLKNCKSVKINALLHIIFIIFTAAAVESLSGFATGRERGRRAGSSKLDAARVTKISFFSIFWTFLAASS
jgi:hypothetical protein